jgi:hypothetical protein
VNAEDDDTDDSDTESLEYEDSIDLDSIEWGWDEFDDLEGVDDAEDSSYDA